MPERLKTEHYMGHGAISAALPSVGKVGIWENDLVLLPGGSGSLPE